jgi:hypothetical protein
VNGNRSDFRNVFTIVKTLKSLTKCYADCTHLTYGTKTGDLLWKRTDEKEAIEARDASGSHVNHLTNGTLPDFQQHHCIFVGESMVTTLLYSSRVSTAIVTSCHNTSHREPLALTNLASNPETSLAGRISERRNASILVIQNGVTIYTHIL